MDDTTSYTGTAPSFNLSSLPPAAQSVKSSEGRRNSTASPPHACEYRPGDWVTVATSSKHTVIGQVVKVQEARPSHILHICRYLRPEETTHRKTDTFWPDEVIKSKETTYHPCAEVIGRCFVLHRDQFPFGRPKPHLWDHTTPIYLCENRYSLDNTTRPFTKITNWKPIDQDSMDAFSTPLQLYKSPSPFLRGVSGPGRLLTDAEVKTMQQAGEAAERSPPAKRPSKRTEPPAIQSNMSTPPSAKRPKRASITKEIMPQQSLTPSLPPLTFDIPMLTATAAGAQSILPPPAASSAPGATVILNPTNEHVGRDEKPPYSYASLIAQAIHNAPSGRARLEQIYEFIMMAYPYYRTAANSWQNMLRHNLSLRPAFVKIARVGGSGKGNWWTLDLSKEPGGFDGTTFGTRRQVAAGNKKLAEQEGRVEAPAPKPKANHSKKASNASNASTKQAIRSTSTSSTSSSAASSSVATPISSQLPTFPSAAPISGPPMSLPLPMPAFPTSQPSVTMTYSSGYAALSHLPLPLAANRQLGKTSSGGSSNDSCGLDLMASICSMVSMQGEEAGIQLAATE